MNRMAGLALAGTGLGAAGLGVAGLTGNLPVSKQQQLEELKAQGIEPTPEQEQQAQDEQLTLWGTGALALGAGAALGAGSSAAWDGLGAAGAAAAGPPGGVAPSGGGRPPGRGPSGGARRKAGGGEVVELIGKLAARSPQMASEVQAILDRKAGLAPPLRVEANPLPAATRFAGAPAVEEGMAAVRQVPLLSSIGQRIARDPAALKDAFRRIGESFEGGTVPYWDGILPTDREMTPAQAIARELESVGEAVSRVSPQWLGEMIDATIEQRPGLPDDPAFLRVLGKRYDMMRGVHAALDLGNSVRNLDEIDRLDAKFARGSVFKARRLAEPTSAEWQAQDSLKPRAYTIDEEDNWRFSDEAVIPGYLMDKHDAAWQNMVRVGTEKRRDVRDDDRALANALAYSVMLNYEDRLRADQSQLLRGALLAKDLDGWLDYHAYLVDTAGQEWVEPELPATWLSPEFYETDTRLDMLKGRGSPYAQLVMDSRQRNIDYFNEALESRGVRGYRERLRARAGK